MNVTVSGTDTPKGQTPSLRIEPEKDLGFRGTAACSKNATYKAEADSFRVPLMSLEAPTIFMHTNLPSDSRTCVCGGLPFSCQNPLSPRAHGPPSA